MRFSTFIVIFLTFSQISLNICNAIMKNEILKKPKKPAPKPAPSKKPAPARKPASDSVNTSVTPSQNKWYQLFVGMLAGLANLSESDIKNFNKCLPSSWQATDTAPGPSDGGNGQSKSSWTAILDGVEKVIGMVCKFKDKIKKLLTGKIRRQVKRSQYKMLLQRSMTRYKKAAQFWKNISKTINKTVGSVGNLADAAWNAVKSMANKVVENIRVFIDTIRQKVNAFLNSDFVKYVKLFYECVQNAKNAALKIIDAIKRLIELVKKITLIVGGDMVALGNLIVDLICNFSLFRKAFTYLADSLNTKDTLTKWSLTGKFIGTFLNAVAVRRNH